MALASVKEKSISSLQDGVQLLRSKTTPSLTQGRPRKGDCSSRVTASGMPIMAEIDLGTKGST